MIQLFFFHLSHKPRIMGTLTTVRQLTPDIVKDLDNQQTAQQREQDKAITQELYVWLAAYNFERKKESKNMKLLKVYADNVEMIILNVQFFTLDRLRNHIMNDAESPLGLEFRKLSAFDQKRFARKIKELIDKGAGRGTIGAKRRNKIAQAQRGFQEFSRGIEQAVEPFAQTIASVPLVPGVPASSLIPSRLGPVAATQDDIEGTIKHEFSVRFPKGNPEGDLLFDDYWEVGYVALSMVLAAEFFIKKKGNGVKIALSKDAVENELEAGMLKLVPSLEQGGNFVNFKFGGPIGSLLNGKLNFELEVNAKFINPVVLIAKTDFLKFPFKVKGKSFEIGCEFSVKLQVTPNYKKLAFTAATSLFSRTAMKIGLKGLASRINPMAYTAMGAYASAAAVGGLAIAATASILYLLGKTAREIKESRADANFARGYSQALYTLVRLSKVHSSATFDRYMNVGEGATMNRIDWVYESDKLVEKTVAKLQSDPTAIEGFQTLIKYGKAAAHQSVDSYVRMFGFARWQEAAAMIERLFITPWVKGKIGQKMILKYQKGTTAKLRKVPDNYLWMTLMEQNANKGRIIGIPPLVMNKVHVSY